VRLAAKLLGWKIDIKSEEEKRQEVEQQMQALSGGPSTPIEQVAELGESIIQKLVAAGITTVESLADMTPEQLEEIPGIGEKTLEKISTAVRHYFGQYEEGEERPAGAVAAEGQERSPNAADLAAVEADVSLDEERAKADAELGEELDALKLDDADGGEEPASADGTGHVVDEIARERIEELTESGDYDAGEVGVLPQDAGRDDTSARLERQNPDPSPLPNGEAEEETVLPDAERQQEDDGV
jgi:N utilization substance protein A